MFPPFDTQPGLLFVVATLVPLASFLVLLLAGGLRNFLRGRRTEGDLADTLFQSLGGEATGRGPAWIATAAIMLSCMLCVIGFAAFLGEHHEMHDQVKANKKKISELSTKAGKHDEKEPAAKGANKEAEPLEEKEGDAHEQIEALFEENEKLEEQFDARWSDRWAWANLWNRIGASNAPSKSYPDAESGSALYVGFRIDHLSAIMFVMVTFIASLIHLFSIGYMSDELQKTVEDHEVHTEHGHFHRRGRFGRFFLFLSLFCFSMLNLILADNLFQVFLSWELVGVCSFLLIGFYYERTSASNAANKAFITNRVGDAGFIIGLLILWTTLGTFDFQEVFARVRAPARDAHGLVNYHDQIMRADKADNQPQSGKGVNLTLTQLRQPGEYVLLYPRYMELDHSKRPHFDFRPPGRTIEAFANPTRIQHGYMPYWMLVVAGLGIFLGCVGKSAQFPLHVWLPDAMEGPTPVSALIHAATMVAAGVYLVGRAYPLFTPEVLLTIAYVGAITLFVAATIAVVMTDIKKVLAYSTVSQLGYMMLGLGVGGWAAGLFHLVTHAFFKALMFLASGSVIYGCHHQQDMLKMGGLYPKMKTTALTMLMGVLAIAGVPLFSGWYSKDAVLAHAMAFSLFAKEHLLLFILPLVTAGITTFYMFRMWFMTFTGAPRDKHVHENAHESPWIMTAPLVILAAFSIFVAWPAPNVFETDASKGNNAVEKGFWPLLDAEQSWLEHQIDHARPGSVAADFGSESVAFSPRGRLKDAHLNAELLAMGMVLVGLTFALIVYYWKMLDPEESREQFPGLHRFLANKWYFDELYSAIFVRPALVVAGWCRNFDLKVIDGLLHGIARVGVRTSRESGRFDLGIIDGSVNLLARVSWNTGAWMRRLQTGYLRSYILFLAIAAVGIWIILQAILGAATGAGR